METAAVLWYLAVMSRWRGAILIVLNEALEPLSARDIAERLGAAESCKGAINGAMSRLVIDGFVRGYKVTRQVNGRSLREMVWCMRDRDAGQRAA